MIVGKVTRPAQYICAGMAVWGVVSAAVRGDYSSSIFQGLAADSLVPDRLPRFTASRDLSSAARFSVSPRRSSSLEHFTTVRTYLSYTISGAVREFRADATLD